MGENELKLGQGVFAHHSRKQNQKVCTKTCLSGGGLQTSFDVQRSELEAMLPSFHSEIYASSMVSPAVSAYLDKHLYCPPNWHMLIKRRLTLLLQKMNHP